MIQINSQNQCQGYMSVFYSGQLQCCYLFCFLSCLLHITEHREWILTRNSFYNLRMSYFYKKKTNIKHVQIRCWGLTAGFVGLCWVYVEESLEIVKLQISSCDDDQTLNSRPVAHITVVWLKQVEISSSSHSLIVEVTPHVEDRRLQPVGAFLNAQLRRFVKI